MKYAVVKIGGSQYKVSVGDEILVDKLDDADKVKAEVLLVADEGKVKVGKPKVSGVEVKFKTLNQEEKGEKITVMKYRAKSRYRKKIGFRPRFTRLLVEEIAS